jgi:hypothetical protein
MTDSGPSPRLAAVEDPEPRREGDSTQRSPASGSTTATPASRRSGRIWTLILIAALVCLGLLLVRQVRYVGQLEVRVEELSSALGEAREVLGVYEHRVWQVRHNLDELSSRVGALQELVSEDSLPASSSADPGGGAPASPSLEAPATTPVR